MRRVATCVALFGITQTYAATIQVPANQPTIQAAINAATNGDQIVVSPGTYAEHINYNGKSIVIRSTGGATVTTLNGQGTDRAVTIQNNETVAAVLDGFTITGGGAHVGYCRPTIRNCIFSNNMGQDGAAMTIDHGGPVVTDCTFSGNIGNGLGAINAWGAGQPVFRRCTFSNNQARPDPLDGDGGAMRLHELTLSATIEDCLFEGNRANVGGAIRSSTGSGTVIRRCTFRSNTANAAGGAIDCTDTCATVIQDCRFEGNTSLGSGGAAGVGGTTAHPRFEKCRFVANTAPSEGGAIQVGWNARCDLVDCEFSGNVSGSTAGALIVREPGTVVNLQRCRFAGNQAVRAGAIGVWAYGTVSLTDCTLSDNVSTEDIGGALSVVDHSSAVVTRCAFRTNSAFNNDGGAIYAGDEGVHVTVQSSHFESNAANNGGGVLVRWQAHLDVQDSTFMGNSARSEGGALSASEGAQAIMSGCHFSGNMADAGGGVSAREDATALTLLKCRLQGNRAGTAGAVHFWHLTGGLIENCVFLGNSAWAGGALASSGTSSGGQVRGCLFANNMAGDQGGAIMLWDQTNSLSVLNSTFSGNRAQNGPAILLENNGAQTLDLSNSVLYGDIRHDGLPEEINGGTPTVQFCLIQGGYSGPNIDADPLFANPTMGDYRLLAGSPCIDSANNPSVPVEFTTDAEGGTRILDGDGDTQAIVDMGAYEYGNLSAQNVTTGTRYATLTGAITAAQAGQEISGTPLLFSLTPVLNFGGKTIALSSTGTIPHEMGTLTEIPSGAGLRAPLSLPILIDGTVRSQNAGQATIEAGSLYLAAGGQLVARQGSILDINTVGGLSLQGDARVEAGALLSVTGDINTFGTCHLLSTSTVVARDGLNNLGSFTAIGSQLDVGAVTNSSSMILSDVRMVASSLTNSQTGQIVGYGELYADVWNVGEIVTTAATTVAGDLLNDGQIRIQNGPLTLVGSLTNNGSIVGDLQSIPLAVMKEGEQDQASASVPNLAVVGDLRLGTKASLVMPLSVWTVSVTGACDNAISASERFDMSTATLLMNGAAREQKLEVMSTNIGARIAGLDRGQPGRYPIGTLHVALPGTLVRMVDERDNDGVGQIDGEALYVDTLLIDTGAVLNNDRYKVYYSTRLGGGLVTTPANAIPYCTASQVPADFDADCDVDAADVAAMRSCVSGPFVRASSACAAKDLDHDTDVDQDDFGILQRCYRGPDLPADPNCAN